MNAASFDFPVARGLRAPGKCATRTCTGVFRARLYGSIVTLTQLSVPQFRYRLAGEQNRLLFVDAQSRRPNSDAPLGTMSNPRAACYLLILILSDAFAAYAKRSILFSLLCFFLLSVPSSAWEKSINAPAERYRGLFSFVASFGRDGGQCVLKQGDSRTILWLRLRRAASSVRHVRAAAATS
jgi:hypothetical protein